MSNAGLRFRAAGLALALPLSVIACAINRNLSVSKTSLVPSPSTMKRDKKVQWARIEPGFHVADYASLWVPEVMLEGNAKDARLGSALARELRKQVVRELAKKYPVTTEAPPAGDAARGATLQLAISDIEGGNGYVRWFLGFGIAPTVLQVEGRITDNGVRDPSVEFVRRRSFDGYPGEVFHFVSFSEERTHRASMREIARDIAAFLGRAGAT